MDTNPSGVSYNIAAALTTLGDHVRLCSMTGSDFSAAKIRQSGAAKGFVTEAELKSLIP